MYGPGPSRSIRARPSSPVFARNGSGSVAATTISAPSTGRSSPSTTTTSSARAGASWSTTSRGPFSSSALVLARARDASYATTHASPRGRSPNRARPSGPVTASPAKCALSPIIANTRTAAPGRGLSDGSVTSTSSTASRCMSATGTAGAIVESDAGRSTVSISPLTNARHVSAATSATTRAPSSQAGILRERARPVTGSVYREIPPDAPAVPSPVTSLRSASSPGCGRPLPPQVEYAWATNLPPRTRAACRPRRAGCRRAEYGSRTAR